MSNVVFSKITAFSTMELVASSVDVEEVKITASVENSLRKIPQSIENRHFSSGFMQLYVYDDEGYFVGVGYIEDWRPSCFPGDVVDSPDEREEHRETVKQERISTLEEETAFDKSWNVVLDKYDMLAGGGDYGQTQFFAVRPDVF